MNWYDYYSLQIVADDIQEDIDEDIDDSNSSIPLDIREHMEHLIKELKRLSNTVYNVGKYIDGDHSAGILRELIQGSGE